MSTVNYAVENGIGTITLDRPGAMNSLDLASRQALVETVRRAAGDPAARCVVLTGSGSAFCVGHDLKEHVASLQRGEENLDDTVEQHYNPIAQLLAGMNKPVVAAINGVAAGAGVSMALACDFRIVAESASFNTAFAGIALSCDTGVSWTLPRIVGRAKALDLLYFPRKISAAEAEELGIATRVVPDTALPDEVAALAGRLAAGPTLAYGSIRQAVEFSGSHPLAESLAFEADKMGLTGASEDHREAVDAFLAKRPAVYRGR